MENPPDFLGKRLLIALDVNPDGLDMIRTVAHRLPDPAQTEVTLMHYLAPVFWECGGDSPETPRNLAKHAWELEEKESIVTFEFFSQARTILRDVGVNANNIRAKEDWSAKSVADAILTQLKDGTYTDVIIGRSHHSALAHLLHLDLAGVLQRHSKDVSVRVIDTPIASTAM